jgi:ABC-2 type transport system ATP-binding protein
MSALTVLDLKKSFNGIQAINGLSFQVPEGEIFGILGPNGAGKTTTIRILVDIFKPDSGEVSVLGMDPGHSKPLIGYMPEERGLYPNLEVLEAPAYLGQLEGLSRREAESRALLAGASRPCRVGRQASQRPQPRDATKTSIHCNHHPCATHDHLG